MKKTKIICTMGPNTNDRELIKSLALVGMDVARFNFSHGDHEEQAGRFALVKSVREELNIPIATLLDTTDRRHQCWSGRRRDRAEPHTGTAAAQ